MIQILVGHDLHWRKVICRYCDAFYGWMKKVQWIPLSRVRQVEASALRRPNRVRTRHLTGGRWIRTSSSATNSQRLGSRSTQWCGLDRSDPRTTQGRPAGIVDLGRTSDHQLASDTAYIHLEIEPLHRRAREMPPQPI